MKGLTLANQIVPYSLTFSENRIEFSSFFKRNSLNIIALDLHLELDYSAKSILFDHLDMQVNEVIFRENSVVEWIEKFNDPHLKCREEDRHLKC